MKNDNRPRGEILNQQLQDARAAQVPNIAEIRSLTEQLVDHIVDYILEHFDEPTLEAPTLEAPSDPPLMVIRNAAPIHSDSRGIASPIKTDDVRVFEDLIRGAFGEIKSCTTAWNGESLFDDCFDSQRREVE
jgi:hypothetical protein